jgi:hypothetical protein
MSLAVFPVFHKTLTGSDGATDGSALGYYMTELEAVALLAKLKPLNAFADSRPIPDDFVGDPDELMEVMGESSDWFDAAEGRDSVRALAEHIRVCPTAKEMIEDHESVVADLEELAGVLEVAAKEGVRFRLEVG